MRKEVRKKRDEVCVSVEESSGNVFADLGLENPEELLAKAQLVQRIADIIAERKLRAGRGGDASGINQPKVSASPPRKARGVLNRPALPVPERLGA